MNESLPIFALVAPTASGKTELALRLSESYPFEIISVDSALVYQGMDIGTAKPTLAERQRVQHHLIDICTPLESYSAARFVSDTVAAIQEIESRGRWPLLVGGTFLYINALMYGLNVLPQADSSYRIQLEEEATIVGWPALHARLALYDPVTAARLHPTDRQRIQRALEVVHLTGKPLSDFFVERALPVQRPIKLMGLDVERAVLHKRIEQRFQGMIQQGFLDEVRALRAALPTLHADLPSMRCVGYRQAWEYLEGEFSSVDWIERGIIATRQLAKRQCTWMRRFTAQEISLFSPLSPQVFKDLTDFIERTISISETFR
jgi:tRNA dimethylallyltransferase